MEQEETVTDPVEPTPAPVPKITFEHLVTSIMQLHNRLVAIENLHVGALRKEANKSRLYRG